MPSNKPKADIDFKDTTAILQHVLKTITEVCKEEAKSKKMVLPLSDPQARVLRYTGLSNTILHKLISGKQLVSQLELSSRILILDTVKSLYIQHRLPTYKTIYDEVCKNLRIEDDRLTSNVTSFVNEMSILGYILKETVNDSVIVMEDPEIRFERFMYLLKLKKFRSNKTQWQQIVYVDERVINDSQEFRKPLLGTETMKPTGLEECVFYHAVTSNGFVTGMFSNQVSENDFAKWMSDIMLIHLKVPSIIIMDCNPLHGCLENASPITRYHSKTEMLRWLINNNIPCSNSMSKPALYELIAKCNENHKEYLIDSVIRSQGHEVLRLPRHLFDLSITTPFWNNVLKNGGVGETSTLMEIQMAVMKLITSTAPTTWADYEQSIENMEKEIFDIDLSMENFCDMYEFKL